jgi:hypothetical protein
MRVERSDTQQVKSRLDSIKRKLEGKAGTQNVALNCALTYTNIFISRAKDGRKTISYRGPRGESSSPAGGRGTEEETTTRGRAYQEARAAAA